MKKKNYWLLIGGAALAWWLIGRRKLQRGTAFARPGAPRRPGAPASATATAENLVASTSFVPDMPTDREIYAASQKQCK